MATSFSDDATNHRNDGEPSSTTDVATPVFPTSASARHLSYTVELYENERWFPMSGWCPKRLPSDRPHFSSKDGKRSLDPIRWELPEGYEWVGDWSIDKDHPDGTDTVGWRYGFAWGTHFHGAPSPSTFVRRRRWIRTMIRTPPQASSDTAAPDAETSTTTMDHGSTARQPPPDGVVSVNNESFDTCGIPSASVPSARMKSRVGSHGRSGATHHHNEVVAQQERTAVPSRQPTTPPPPSETEQRSTQDVVGQGDEDEDGQNGDGITSSASMRYFMERQGTSSVIGGNRRVAAAAVSDEDDAGVVSTGAVEAEAEGVPTGHIPDPTEVVDVADADAAFYGYADAAFNGCNDDGSADGDGQSLTRRRGSVVAETSEDIEAFNFQKTVSEIVEDVDRSFAAEQQTPGFALTLEPPSIVPHHAVGEGDDTDDDGDALFSNMLQDFVERAKDD